MSIAVEDRRKCEDEAVTSSTKVLFDIFLSMMACVVIAVVHSLLCEMRLLRCLNKSNKDCCFILSFRHVLRADASLVIATEAAVEVNADIVDAFICCLVLLYNLMMMI